MPSAPLPYKHFYIWAESEEDGYRSYVARQDGRDIRNDAGELVRGPRLTCSTRKTERSIMRARWPTSSSNSCRPCQPSRLLVTSRWLVGDLPWRFHAAQH